jgi:Methyltransferase domain
VTETRFQSNEALVRAAASCIVARLTRPGGAAPRVRLLGDPSEALRQDLAPYLAPAVAAALSSSRSEIRPLSRLKRLFGGREAAPPGGVLCLSVFYAQAQEQVEAALASLARDCEAVVIVDQVDNMYGVRSNILQLRDAGGRPYEAFCHPFGHIVHRLGFSHVVSIAAPSPAKSISGVIIATRSLPITEAEVRAAAVAAKAVEPAPAHPVRNVPPYSQRVARLQREGDDAYLRKYWDAYEKDRFKEVVRIVSQLVAGRETDDADTPFGIFDFGCSSGPLFRAVAEHLGSKVKAHLVGADPDRRALAFLRERMPEVTTIETDAIRFRAIGFADTACFDVCISTSVLLLLPEAEVWDILDDFACMAPAIVIVDQIENFDGEEADVRKLVDHKGAEYEAVCHPFGTWLRRRGFTDIQVTALAEPEKGASGIILARRDGRAESRPEYQAYRERVARLQREGDESYLQTYWNAYDQKRFTEVSAAVAALLIPADSDEAAGRRRVSIFDFACSAGPLFRALESHMGAQLDFSLAGADADRKAASFIRRNLPGALVFEADPQRLRDLGFSASERFDLCTATSLCYALDDQAVRVLLAELATLSDLMIVADQIENIDGEQAVTLRLTNFSDAEYDAYCHPFRTILRQLGFAAVEVVPVMEPVKSITGLVIARRSGPLPPALRQEIERRTKYAYFGRHPGPEPMITIFGARPPFDASDEQIERLPTGIDIVEGRIHSGPELIGNTGIKLAGPIPRGGSVQFEVEAGSKTHLTNMVGWKRDAFELEQISFSPLDLFPKQSQPPGENWQPYQWGSWGGLSIENDVLVANLVPNMDVDANQADGMGPLDLLFYMHPKADLRDAVVELEMRGRNFDPGDAEVYVWFQNKVPVEQFNKRFGTRLSGVERVSSNYALTSVPLAAHLANCEWHTIRISLTNDPSLWSFAGNVFADGRNAVRYSYMSLEDALQQAFNLHILACYPRDVPNFLNKRDLSRFGQRPSGAVELRRCRIVTDDSDPRVANVDVLLPDGVRDGRYRTVNTDATRTVARSDWYRFTLPSERRPVVSRLALESKTHRISGRVNAMGYRTWCWLENEPGGRLYLGATKHSRDFVFRAPRELKEQARFVLANQAGGVAFSLAGLRSR